MMLRTLVLLLAAPPCLSLVAGGHRCGDVRMQVAPGTKLLVIGGNGYAGSPRFTPAEQREMPKTSLLLLGVVAVAGDFRVKFEIEVPSGSKEFTVLVHEEWAPIGAARFKELVQAKFYDNTRPVPRGKTRRPGGGPLSELRDRATAA